MAPTGISGLPAELPSDLLAEVGRPVDPDGENDVHRASVGSFEIVLRRDCHGVLRKAEIAFPGPMRGEIRTRVAPTGWQIVAPGELDLLDMPGVGKLYLLCERLSIVFRMNVTQGEIVGLISRCLAVGEPTAVAR